MEVDKRERERLLTLCWLRWEVSDMAINILVQY